MSTFKKAFLLSSILTLSIVPFSQAYTISSAPSNLTLPELQANYSVRGNDDTGDAVGYAGARHDTSEWNFLGRDSKNDDGVRWSTDGGTTWGNETVFVGETIKFQITLWSAGYGQHTYDQAKAWVDWNNDKSWLNDNALVPGNAGYISNETVLAGKYNKNANAIHPDPGTDEAKLSDNLNYDMFSTFTTDAYLITDSMVGTLWLRARAQCNHVGYNNMNPYDYLSQGEVEDWGITVSRSPVPEPATMLLFGAGIIGLASVCRKKRG